MHRSGGAMLMILQWGLPELSIEPKAVQPTFLGLYWRALPLWVWRMPPLLPTEIRTLSGSAASNSLSFPCSLTSMESLQKTSIAGDTTQESNAMVRRLEKIFLTKLLTRNVSRLSVQPSLIIAFTTDTIPMLH